MHCIPDIANDCSIRSFKYSIIIIYNHNKFLIFITLAFLLNGSVNIIMVHSVHLSQLTIYALQNLFNIGLTRLLFTVLMYAFDV